LVKVTNKTILVLFLATLCLSLILSSSFSAEAKKKKGLTVKVYFEYPEKKDTDLQKLLKKHPDWYKMELSWQSDSGGDHLKKLDLNKFPSKYEIKNFKVKVGEEFHVGLNSGGLDEGADVCKVHSSDKKDEKVTFSITTDIHGKGDNCG
jgi:hypothetical protein